ncbi:MAG: bi-domain-containing oxidoreductase [Ignavibacteriales bacterium]|nr:bi-domain-containing oxidoreductase [Ignavibacteriales bacterium]
MKQFIQSYKTGKMEVVEVPMPSCGSNGILVQTTASLISAGTEKMLIDIAKKSLVGKAKARPDLVKQVLNKMKKEGVKTTLEKVFNKLESPIPLGYSCSGNVLMTGRNITGTQAGDRVACAGAGYANHAEVNYIPKNLFAKIPDNVTDEDAAYTTVGSIALQGVRQLNPMLGERFAVIGSGLIGLITVQLLKANGCDVLAVDIDPDKLKLAKKCGADEICDGKNLYELAFSFSKGYGVDGVIITASSNSKQIIVDAGEICRSKGRVIMVGLTPIDIPRDIYYKKELDFRMSMSYGPGRYDPQYENEGIDYPIAYVRWTEQRNMEAFLGLLAQKRLNMSVLTTHSYKFDDILIAYKLVSGESKEPFLGIILNYDIRKQHSAVVELYKKVVPINSSITIGLIGAGNFAQSVTIPQLIKNDCKLHTLVNSSSVKSISMGRKFNFKSITSDAQPVFTNPDINTVFITTPHNSHAKYIIDALSHNKNVFVEKPLAINEAQLVEVTEAYRTSEKHLMIGFNRRFSSHAEKIKIAFKNVSDPLTMNYIVNAGTIPVEHWIQNPDIGGGRIIGEVCHFIDFLQFICGSMPTNVFAFTIGSDNNQFNNNDSIQIVLKFANGSIGNISYNALGDNSLPKEYFEVSGGQKTAKLYDFWRSEITANGRTQKYKTKTQDKGFNKEIKQFLDAISQGSKTPIPFESIYATTQTTFRIIESLQTGLSLVI